MAMFEAAKGEEDSLMDDDRGSLLYLSLACAVAALGGLLFGFDTAVISGAIDQVQAQFALMDWMKGWIVSSAIDRLPDRFGDRRHAERPLRPQENPARGGRAVYALCDWIGHAAGAVAPGRGAAGRRHGHRHRLDALAAVHRRDFAARRRGGLIAGYQLAITIGILAAICELRPGRDGPAVSRVLWIGHLAVVFVDEVWRGMLLAGLLPAVVCSGCCCLCRKVPAG